MIRKAIAAVALGLLIGTAAPLGTSCATVPGGGGACCKICRSGTACGDTCIPAGRTCAAGRGCACQG